MNTDFLPSFKSRTTTPKSEMFGPNVADKYASVVTKSFWVWGVIFSCALLCALQILLDSNNNTMSN